MLRRVLALALFTAVVAPLAAQTPSDLKMRVDRSQNAQDPDDNPELKVVTAGKGYRVTGGPAATLWNPAHTAAGNYTVRATFTLMQPSNHLNYYGLVFGGSELEGANQQYGYFIVAQNGTFQVRHRMSEKVENIQARTPHQAIKQPEGSGQSVNTLEVRVMGDTVSYVVNDTVVHTAPKGTMRTDGLVGVRVNHMLDVQVDGFELRKN
jgi:hypothetical protein